MKAAVWIAVGLSLAGSLVAAGAYWRVRSTSPQAAGNPAAIESLKARVAHLEAELARSNQAVARLEREEKTAGETGHAHAPSSHATGDTANLVKRIEVLERQMAASRPIPGQLGRGAQPNAAVLEGQKKRLLDPNLTELDRARALGMMRLQGGHKADEVVDAALGLLAQSKEARTRALIIRNLHGSGNPKLVAPLLGVLASDADEDVRDEAAETLDDFVAQPEVKAALEQAASSDASEKVRRRAQASLATPARPK